LLKKQPHKQTIFHSGQLTGTGFRLGGRAVNTAFMLGRPGHMNA